MDLFGNLSYKKNQLAPIGSPVDALAGLYEKKQADFDYVVDNTNLMDTALSNLQYNEQDADKVSAARNHFKEVIDGFNVEGDLENRVLDTKKLVNDLNNKYGLTAIQQDFAKRQAYISDLKEQYSKNDISKRDMDRNIQYSDRVSRGVQQDADGRFSPGYSGRSVIRNVDLSKEVMDIVDGVKADSIIGADGESYQLKKTSNGYINAVTGEAVSADKATQIAKSYLLNNNDFKDRVDEEVFFELNNILTNPETGEREQMTMDDLAAATGVRDIDGLIKEKYGLSPEEVDPNAVYKDIRKEQLANQYIKPAVTKETYMKLDNTFKKDWQLEAQMKANAEEQAAATIREAGIVKTYATKDRFTSQDFERTSKVHTDAKANVTNLTNELNALKDSNASPDMINRKQEAINEQQRLVNLIEGNNQKLLESNPVMRTEMANFVSNFTDTGQNRSTGKPFIHGLSINQGELEKLAFSSVSGNLSDAELKKYIDVKKIEEEANSPEGAQAVYNNSLKMLRDKVSKLGSSIQTKIDNGDMGYNVNYKGVQLPDNLSAKEKRSHPVARLQEYTTGLKEKDTQYFNSLTDLDTGLDIATSIEEQYGVDNEDGEINWDSGILVPLMSKVPNSKGGYDTAIAFDVKIGEDKKNQEYKRFIVRSTEDSYNSKTEELYEDYRKELLNKSVLTPTDKRLLSDVNLSRFNSTKEGQEMDLLNLAKMSNREIVSFNLPKGIEGHIQAFKNASPQGLSYYLVDKNGDQVKYWVENAEGVRKSVTEEELSNNDGYKAIGGNSVADIKQKIANTGFNSGAFVDEEYRVSPNETVDISGYFGQDIKDGVNPRVHVSIEDNVKFLKDLYPGILLTDGLRPDESDTGAENSLHKYAKALDLRLSPDARAVVNMTPDRKRRLGIKTAEVHNDHVHVEFL